MSDEQHFGEVMWLTSKQQLNRTAITLSDENSFWGFYLGRPFRMNAGDISVPKPASTLGADKEGTWRPYGLPMTSKVLQCGLKNPTELIFRQFVVLWDMISPVGHIL